MEEQVKAPFLKPALIYGAILGGAGVLLGLIFYFLDLTTASWTQWVNLVVGIAVMVYCLVAYRNEYLGGFGSYGQIFKMALVISIIAALIGTIYTYLLMVVLDPDLVDKMKLAAEERIMNNPRIPESMYDQTIERIERSMAPRRMIINSFIFGTVLNVILGLIVAAFVKKEPKADIPV